MLARKYLLRWEALAIVMGLIGTIYFTSNYFTSKNHRLVNAQPDKNVTYMMPERTGDVKVNDGRIYSPTIASAQVSGDTSENVATENVTNVTIDDFNDAIEECCADDAFYLEEDNGLSFEERYTAWQFAMEEYTAKTQANMQASLDQDDKILLNALTILTFATPEQRRNIIAELGEIEPELQTFLDNMPPRPPAGVTVGELLEELQVLLIANTDVYSRAELNEPFIE